MNHGCPNNKKKIVVEKGNRPVTLNIKKDLVSSTKCGLGNVGKEIKPLQQSSRPFTGKNVANAKVESKNSKKDSHHSLDNFAKVSDFKASAQPSHIVGHSVPVDDKPVVNHDHSDSELEKKEQICVKNEIMDIANMLESLQLQTPSKPQIKLAPKSINIQTAGDGVCISTDGTCLTVLTPVRASRKVEKGILFRLIR